MLQTIVPAVLRPVPSFEFQLQPFRLPDGDEIALNWLLGSFRKLVIVVPGLESNSTRSYIKNLAHYLHQSEFDVLVVDHRGCRIPNKVFRSYHSGNTEDLKVIVESLEHLRYKQIYLVGFSLGGNIVLKYLGENVDNPIYRAASVCAPIDLLLCSKELETKRNRIFRHRFVKSLKKNLLIKQKAFPSLLDIESIKSCKSLWDIDELYTAPVHGFRNAEDYYIRCSSRLYIKHISVPTMVLNAKNDPLIPLDEDMVGLLNEHPTLFPVITASGGHMGYPTKWLRGINYYEKAIIDYFT
jgi:uncharacterized protein